LASSSDSDSHVDDAQSAGASDRPLAARPAVIAVVAGEGADGSGIDATVSDRIAWVIDGRAAASRADLARSYRDGVDERLDRDAVERVLRRAHAIEAQEAPAPDDGIEPAALVAAATEVGIDPNAVRDSLALERFVGPGAVERRFDRVAGPDRVVVERELHLTADAAMAGIEAWLAGPYRLSCDRRSASTLLARRRTDAMAQVLRSFTGARGDGNLGVAGLVAEAVPRLSGSTPTQPRCAVRISADRSTSRRIRLDGGALLGAGGLGIGGVVAVASDVVLVWPVLAAPLLVSGYALARSGRGQADRVELELERLLSRVDRGERPISLLGRVAKRARNAVAPPR